jgi:hypothetical protein
VSTFSVAEARGRAKVARQHLAHGLDPLEERQKALAAAKLEAAKAMTFKQAAESYIKAHQAGWKSEKHAEQWTATLETYAYPVIGNLSVAAVDTTLVARVLEDIWLSKSATASRVRVYDDVVALGSVSSRTTRLRGCGLSSWAWFRWRHGCSCCRAARRERRGQVTWRR